MQELLESTEMTILRQGCQTWGLELSARQIAQFELFYRELCEWNKKFNLTAITERNEVQTKHFLDSLAGLPILADELGYSLPFSQPLQCVDVGTGAGFPGIPLKIVLPDLHWTLIDGTGKKVLFLQQVVAQLQLQLVKVVQGRAEELGRHPDYRDKFDLVTARAVAPLNTLVEYLLPLACMQGLVMIYKGANAPQEFVKARKAIHLLGGEVMRMAPVKVPFLEEQRYLLLIKKVRQTPNLYPRGQGLERKKPLE